MRLKKYNKKKDPKQVAIRRVETKFQIKIN
jgi:hypothetical protein